MTGKKIRMMTAAHPASSGISRRQPLKPQNLAWNAADEDDVRITVRMQDEAAVVSADFHLKGQKEILMGALQGQMEVLAAQIAADGGIVGHIKASVEYSETAVISVTLDKADVRKGALGGISGKFAAIVLLVEETKVRELTEAMFETVKENIKDAGSRVDSRQKQKKVRTKNECW